MKVNKTKIQNLGLKAIEDYFNVDINQISKEVLTHLHHKAKIGLQFEKEMNLTKRAIEMNYLRVFRLVAEDKKELRNMIKKSIPDYLPS